MQPNVYVTDHFHSKTVCAAFAEGCGGDLAPVELPVWSLPRDGPAVVYGILRGCGEIIKACEWVGRDYYHIDLGYFKRGHYDGCYRVSLNGLQACNLVAGRAGVGAEPDRWEALEIPLKPWKKTGRHVVVCPPTKAMGDFLGIDPVNWTHTVVREISRYTDRPIVVKPKVDGFRWDYSSDVWLLMDARPLEEILEDTWCLVTHSSNAAVDAIVSGIPVVVLGRSAVDDVSWNLRNIEDPEWPAREWWCHELAHHQFTLDEMRSGYAWERLNV